jgi:hypothetical protein
MTSIIIIDKNCAIKTLCVKEYKEEELYKKCGFKKADGFKNHTDWSIKLSGTKYLVTIYGKTEGKANSENKYDFPPPVDNILFFGSCALVCRLDTKENKDKKIPCNLTLEMWNQMYEKLFGGFEDLALTSAEDEQEIDELANVPKEKKTKQGYLKDGFVIDSGGDSDDPDTEAFDSNISSDEMSSTENDETGGSDVDLLLEDFGSELEEEEYDYSESELE